MPARRHASMNATISPPGNPNTNSTPRLANSAASTSACVDIRSIVAVGQVFWPATVRTTLDPNVRAITHHRADSAGSTREQIPAMLQALFAERFKLEAHTEQRARTG